MIAAVITAAAAATALAVLVVIPLPVEETGPLPIYESGFTYYDIEAIRHTLAQRGIEVSDVSAITDHTIGRYCLYPAGDGNETITYCTTTVVRGPGGETLGNINIGGGIDSPVMAVANMETYTLESEREHVHAIFVAMIESLACECWEEESDEYETPRSWFAAAEAFYAESGRDSIRSEVKGLGDTDLLLEITSGGGSVFRTLLVLK